MTLSRWVVLGAVVTVSACAGGTGGGGTGGGTGGDPDSGTGCNVTNVSDGPTTDSAADAGTFLSCYYFQPSEGYCRKITNPATVSTYLGNRNKGGIGCGSAVVLIDTECPTKNSAGSCENNSIDAKRVYYTCSKFADPQAHCGQISGTFKAP